MLKNTPILNLVKIHEGGAHFFMRRRGRRDRHDEADSRFSDMCFHDRAAAPRLVIIL
jgi:hypothetical protein